MGGAMHAYLSFLDFGITSLESGFARTEQTDMQTKASISDRLQKSKAIKWVLKTLNIDLEENAKKIEENYTDSNKVRESDEKSEKGIFEKINSISNRFGLNVSKDEALTFPLVCVLISIMFLFFCIKAFGEFINKYFLKWVGARIVADIRAALFDNYQRQSVDFFAKNEIGTIISNSTNDTAVIEHSFSSSIAEMFIAPVQLIVAVNFVINKAYSSNLIQPTLILIIAMPVVFVPVFIITKLIRRYQHRVLDRVSTLVSRMQENLGGIRVVKAFNTESREIEAFRKDNSKYFKSVVKSLLADIFMQPTMQMTAIALGAGFIILCFHYKVSLGALAVLGYAAQNAYKPIKELAKMNSSLQKCAAAAERVFNALDVRTALPEPQNPTAISALARSINFNDVDFYYETEHHPVLKDFSLEIKKGQLVAIVGPTGSGKSTLANLLARFYDPNKGSITFDGIDLRNISNTDIRRMVGIVAQDTFLFSDTIAYNIQYGTPDASLEQIIDAAKQANAHDFIMEDPQGYDRPAGERGCLLSGGQKQRIAIARAILKNPPILILDEATSALDTVTEQLVQQALTKLMKDRTVLAIAHRLSTIVNADKIVLIDNGGIVEQGTHAQLYAFNGRYKQLYDMQLASANSK